MKTAGFILVIKSYLVRKGMASVLSGIPGIRIIREFGEAETFVRFMTNHGCDFLVIGADLFDLASELFHKDPGLLDKTLLLRNADTPGPGEGKETVLYQSDSKEELNRKIDAYIDRLSVKIPTADSRDLTNREKTIVRLVSMGNTNKQIAQELFLSTHTVITHRKNIAAKLGIRSVSALTVYALVNNIISMEEVASNPRS